MSSSSWNDYLLTGIIKVDEQHRELVKRVDGLIDAVRGGKAADELSVMLNFLAQYVEFHFDAEFAYLDEIEHPSKEMHHTEHEKFKETLRDFNKRLVTERNPEKLAHVVKKELLDWLVNHIGKIDKEIGKH